MVFDNIISFLFSLQDSSTNYNTILAGVNFKRIILCLIVPLCISELWNSIKDESLKKTATWY